MVYFPDPFQTICQLEWEIFVKESFFLNYGTPSPLTGAGWVAFDPALRWSHAPAGPSICALPVRADPNGPASGFSTPPVLDRRPLLDKFRGFPTF